MSIAQIGRSAYDCAIFAGEDHPEGGDNLFLCSIVALNPDTGEYKWHYQTTPAR